jgi:hypothetical protein
MLHGDGRIFLGSDLLARHLLQREAE